MRSNAMPFLRRNIVILSIFSLGILLRIYHLDSAPHWNETADEFAWTWSGMSLWREGVPRAWSLIYGAYNNHYPVDWKGFTYHMVTPWLDHPPLFSLVMGGWMLIGGYKELFWVDLAYMRVFSLILFTANFWLLWVVLRRFFETSVVSVGLLFFCVAPMAVINTKLVISENFFLFVYLLSHYCLIRYDETQGRRYLVGLVLGAVALPLIKVAALSLSAYLTVVAALRGRRPLLYAMLGGTAAGLALYLLYGHHFGWTLFTRVLRQHGSRFHGFDGIAELLFQHPMVHTMFIYYPFILGLITIFSDLGEKRYQEFYLQYVAYVGCMVFFVEQHYVFGWYLIPVYPVLAIGLGRYIVRMYQRAEALYVWGFAAICLPYIFQLLHLRFRDSLSLLRYSYLALFLAVPVVFWLARDRRPAFYRAFGVALVAGVVLVDIGFVLAR